MVHHLQMSADLLSISDLVTTRTRHLSMQAGEGGEGGEGVWGADDTQDL